MATFVIIPTTQTAEQRTALSASIQTEFGDESYALPNGEWLVSFEGTSRQLSDKLLISDGVHGSAIVLSFSAYWGRANKDLWEWLNLKQK